MIKLEERGELAVITVSGALTWSEVRAQHVAVRARVERGGPVLVDARGLESVTGLGLRFLLALHRAGAHGGARVVVVGLGGAARELASLAGFLELYTTAPTLEEALAWLGVSEEVW